MIKKYSNRGFTLIELLVVIAIIGILSSVVLASLSTARNKGTDAKIQGQLASIRNAAEIAYNGSSYGTASAANDCAGLVGNAALTTLVTASNWPNNTAPTCTSNATAGGSISGWSMWHALQTSGGWCVDSTGASVSLVSPPAAGKNCAAGDL